MKKTIKLLLFIVLFIFLLVKFQFYTSLIGGILLALIVILGSIENNNKDDIPSPSPYPWWYIFFEFLEKNNYDRENTKR